MAPTLREELKKRGWSQSELARRANLNNATVNQVVNGRLLPYPGQITKLAAALSVSETRVKAMVGV